MGQSYWGSQAAALFSWEPLDFGLRSARVGQARSAEAKSQADLALTQLQVAAAVGNYFLLAVANQQAVLAAQANLDRWQVFNKSIHVLVDNQLRAWSGTVARADAELARAKIHLYQSQQAEHVALDTLAALMGTAGREIKLDSGRLLDLSSAASLPDVSALEIPRDRHQMAEVRQIQTEEKILQRERLSSHFPAGRGSSAAAAKFPITERSSGNWNGLAPARGNWITGITNSCFFLDVLWVQSTECPKADFESQ